MALNGLGAITAAYAMGLDHRQAASDLAESFSPPRRGRTDQVQLGGRSVTLIDDSHNANPLSMRAGLAYLAESEPSSSGRRIAVLSDMLELDDDTAQHHRDLLDPLQEAGTHRVYLTGDLMSHLWEALPGTLRGAHASSPQQLQETLLKDLRDGDIVFFKGSHGTELFRTAARLRRSGTTKSRRDPGEQWFHGTAAQLPVQQRNTPAMVVRHGGRVHLSADGRAGWPITRFARIFFLLWGGRSASESSDSADGPAISPDVPEILKSRRQTQDLVDQLGGSRAALEHVRSMLLTEGFTSTNLDSVLGIASDVSTAEDLAQAFETLIAEHSLSRADTATAPVWRRTLHQQGWAWAFRAEGRTGETHLLAAAPTASGEPLVGVVLGARSIGHAAASLRLASEAACSAPLPLVENGHSDGKRPRSTG
ncbi:glutamate ligase domain-containing protein [Nesterenkonia sp. PF2B19]|uniref:glutamate ligase domain-containing protein n=1 Tax=Nesterenkonia sp. PF2B19 TaxID=1881858 RepID=UPI0008731E31|nr:cyanophycin synthetase [Nesterenkonia sp. PF2B19]